MGRDLHAAKHPTSSKLRLTSRFDGTSCGREERVRFRTAHRADFEHLLRERSDGSRLPDSPHRGIGFNNLSFWVLRAFVGREGIRSSQMVAQTARTTYAAGLRSRYSSLQTPVRLGVRSGEYFGRKGQLGSGGTD